MKKKIIAAILSVTFTMSFNLVGCAYALTTISPFSDVPKSNWAYSAVEELVKKGIIEVGPDKMFRGNQNVTRYELAAIIVRAVSSYKGADNHSISLLEKLVREFAVELRDIEIQSNNSQVQVKMKVKNLEKKVNTLPKVSGTFSVLNYTTMSQLVDLYGRTVINPKCDETFFSTNKFRTNLQFNGNIDTKWNYIGELQLELPMNYKDYENNSNVNAQMRSICANGNFCNGCKVNIGRFGASSTLLSNGVQGLLYGDNRINGARLVYENKGFKADIFGGFSDVGMPRYYSIGGMERGALGTGFMLGYSVNDIVNIYAGIKEHIGHNAPRKNNPYSKETWSPIQHITFAEGGFDIKPIENVKISSLFGWSPNMKDEYIYLWNGKPHGFFQAPFLENRGFYDNIACIARIDVGDFDLQKRWSLNAYGQFHYAGKYAIINKYIPLSVDVDGYDYGHGNDGICLGKEGREAGMNFVLFKNVNWHTFVTQTSMEPTLNRMVRVPYLVTRKGKLSWDRLHYWERDPIVTVGSELSFSF